MRSGTRDGPAGDGGDATARLLRDPAGRALKAVALALLILPAALVLADIIAGALPPRPVEDVIQRTGSWAIWFLIAALAVTPVRLISGITALARLRRMIGLAAFAYALAHLGAYVVDQAFDLGRVAAEIARRFYLAIGFGALLILVALAATSTDRMIRRLGAGRWRRLHALVVPAAVLSAVHFFLQSKLDRHAATIAAGILAFLLLYRLLFGRRPARAAAVFALGIGVGGGVILAEAVALAAAFPVAIADVLAANVSLETGVRPGVVVVAAGIGVGLAALVRDRWRA